MYVIEMIPCSVTPTQAFVNTYPLPCTAQQPQRQAFFYTINFFSDALEKLHFWDRFYADILVTEAISQKHLHC